MLPAQHRRAEADREAIAVGRQVEHRAVRRQALGEGVASARYWRREIGRPRAAANGGVEVAGADERPRRQS